MAGKSLSGQDGDERAQDAGALMPAPKAEGGPATARDYPLTQISRADAIAAWRHGATQ